MHLENTTIVFDLDGTLIDTAPDVCHALNRTLAKIGRRPHTIDEVKDYMGRGAHITMQRALGVTGDVPSDDVIEQLTADFLGDYAQNPIEDSTVYPYVFEVLEQLRDFGAILGICTNKPSITAAPVLRAFGLDQQFDAIVCGDQTKNCKPVGSHILETIAHANGHRNKAIMIGDSENDVDAAIDANIPSIAVTFGYAHKPHADLGANLLINHYEQLFPAITKLISDN